MSVDARFALGAGRPRPAYRPKTVSCPRCGAGQTVRDERARLVVCAACGSHLALEAEELRVLGERVDGRWAFVFALGDRFAWRGTEYEVAARMAFVEEGGPASDATLQYLLYHPLRGSRWLSAYAGHYDLSWPSHVAPAGDPFASKPGDDLATHDGRAWVAIESTAYRLAYVDGALPWIARVGDAVRAAEFAAADGSPGRFEVETSGDQVEYGEGLALDHAAVVEASGKRDLHAPRRAGEDVVARRRGYRFLRRVASWATAVNVALWLVAGCSGHTVLEQRFSAAELSDEPLSEPFTIAPDERVVRVDLEAPGLANAWMAVDVAVVEGDDTVVHADDADIEYYFGREGGESWREGGRKKALWVRLPEAGRYRLLLGAVSAPGETPTAAEARHDLVVSVRAGAIRSWPLLAMAALSLAVLLGAVLRYHSWRQDDDDDD